jgi:NADH:ubiquinone oxidoreductase subunit 3 (subunit A)
MVLVIVLLLGIIGKRTEEETRRKSPLERGFSTTGRILRTLSLQFFVILVLFLVLDLEVVLVVALVLGGSTGRVRRGILIRFILGRL